MRANAHRLLEGSWLGTTDFQEVAEYIDDDSDEDWEEEDEEDVQEEELAKEPRVPEEEARRVETAVEPRVSPECEYFELSPQKDKTAPPQSLNSLTESAVEKYEARLARFSWARRDSR